MGGRQGRIFHPLYMNSSNLVKLTIVDAYSEADVDDGTVTMTLVDNDEADVTGAIDIALTASGSDGIWYGYIPDTITLVEKAIYRLEINIEDLSGSVLLDVRWYKACYYPNTEVEEL